MLIIFIQECPYALKWLLFHKRTDLSLNNSPKIIRVKLLLVCLQNSQLDGDLPTSSLLNSGIDNLTEPSFFLGRFLFYLNAVSTEVCQRAKLV